MNFSTYLIARFVTLPFYRVFKGKKRSTLLSVQTSATYDLELSAG